MSEVKTAIAGTLESNDIMITVSSLKPGEKNSITLESAVMKQFGQAIIATIEESLKLFKTDSVHIDAKDKGALECTIKARMETAIARYNEKM